MLVLLEKWKRSLDRGKAFGALLKDLTKAFDCLNHELLIVKDNAYGCSQPALRLIHDYFSNRKQREKLTALILNGYWTVPHWLIPGPLLFNISIIILIMDGMDIANYADDNTPYVTADDIDWATASLENASNIFFKWFTHNLLKGNVSKCHLLVKVKDEVSMRIGDFSIVNSEREKLLGVKSADNLTFNNHVLDVCKNASWKINAITRDVSYMSSSIQMGVSGHFGVLEHFG